MLPRELRLLREPARSWPVGRQVALEHVGQTGLEPQQVLGQALLDVLQVDHGGIEAGGVELGLGEVLEDHVEIGLNLPVDPEQRSLGLMHRRKAPKDGMLFVFPRAESGGFWMKNTLVPLRITFFDSRGKMVRRMRMTPCRRDPCAIYDPGKMYRYALELRATDRRPAKRLGPLRRLRQLIESAS